MTQEIKEWAHKEFDEKFPIVNIGRDIKFNEINGKEAIKSFLDSLIDKTVQMERERIVGMIDRIDFGLVTRGKAEVISTVKHKLKKKLSLTTNKSDINNLTE